MIYIKTNSRRGGFVENIWAENICGKRARFGVVGIDQYYDGNPVKELGKKYVKTYPTRIANVNVRNIECGLARNGVQIVGDKELMPTGDSNTAELTLEGECDLPVPPPLTPVNQKVYDTPHSTNSLS